MRQNPLLGGLRHGTLLLLLLCLVWPQSAHLQTIETTEVVPTRVTVSICGDSVINAGEECDVPGETGVYSTTIAGRQCTPACFFGPYCGDNILQTLFEEECDDGNNQDGDFCSAECKVEPAGFGGGGGGGGGSGGSGGSSSELGETQVHVEGEAYPSQTLHILLDAAEVGTVRTASDGSFEFATDAEPGTASMGFWSLDEAKTRSITFNTTFDVTQGAITNLRGIKLPPTIRAQPTELNPGDPIVFSGQTAPAKTVQLFIDNSQAAEVKSDANGNWTITYATGGLAAAEHTVKTRYVSGSGSGPTSESSFSSLLTLFVGVEGRAVTPSDLNRDGKVNLTDFSILIFWWQTNGGTANPSADINGNGNVGLEDFSILLFNWSG